MITVVFVAMQRLSRFPVGFGTDRGRSWRRRKLALRRGSTSDAEALQNATRFAFRKTGGRHPNVPSLNRGISVIDFSAPGKGALLTAPHTRAGNVLIHCIRASVKTGCLF